MTMNVLVILLTNEFPPDVRVEGEIKAITKQGFKVFLLNIRDKRKRFEDMEGVMILRLPAPINFFISYFFHTILLIFLLPAFCNAWNISIIHVHDLLHSIPVSFISKIFGYRVVIDLHEDYLGTCMMKTQKYMIGIKKILLNFWMNIISFLEPISLSISSRIITVSDEETKRILRIGIPRKKISCIKNIMTIERIKNINIGNIQFNNFKDKFVISYIGGFSKHRGLETLLKAIPLVLSKYRNIHLFLVGDGRNVKELKALSIKLNIMDYVTFTGWVSFEDAMSYMKGSDIFVIPYIRSSQTDKALPHKLFQAMYLGKCVVVSDVPEMKKIIHQCQCGVVFKAESHVDLAETILKLLKEPNLIEYYGHNGTKSIITKYNWNKESEKLLKIYKDLIISTN